MTGRNRCAAASTVHRLLSAESGGSDPKICRRSGSHSKEEFGIFGGRTLRANLLGKYGSCYGEIKCLTSRVHTVEDDLKAS